MIEALHEFLPVLATVGRPEQLVGNNDKHGAVRGVIWRENQSIDGIVRIMGAQVLDVNEPDRNNDRQDEQAGDAYTLPTEAFWAHCWAGLGSWFLLWQRRVGSTGHT